MRVALCVTCLFIVAGCAEGTTDGAGVRASDECNARAQRGLVGRVVTDMAAVAQAAPKVRLIFPGDAVTQDHQPDRLNVVFDGSNRVTRVYCG